MTGQLNIMEMRKDISVNEVFCLYNLINIVEGM